MSQCTRLTDRRTDRNLIVRPRCIPCSAVINEQFGITMECSLIVTLSLHIFALHCHISRDNLSLALTSFFNCWICHVIPIQIPLPESKHMAGNLCGSVVERVPTHSSPGVIVVDFKASGIRRSIVTSKSHRH